MSKLLISKSLTEPKKRAQNSFQTINLRKFDHFHQTTLLGQKNPNTQLLYRKRTIQPQYTQFHKIRSMSQQFDFDMQFQKTSSPASDSQKLFSTSLNRRIRYASENQSQIGLVTANNLNSRLRRHSKQEDLNIHKLEAAKTVSQQIRKNCNPEESLGKDDDLQVFDLKNRNRLIAPEAKLFRSQKIIKTGEEELNQMMNTRYSNWKPKKNHAKQLHLSKDQHLRTTAGFGTASNDGKQESFFMKCRNEKKYSILRISLQRRVQA